MPIRNLYISGGYISHSIINHSSELSLDAGKGYVKPSLLLTLTFLCLSLKPPAHTNKKIGTMINKRFNISLTNGAVDDIELLRELLEKRLKQRLSIAQVIKRLTKIALEEEKSHT